MQDEPCQVVAQADNICGARDAYAKLVDMATATTKDRQLKILSRHRLGLARLHACRYTCATYRRVSLLDPDAQNSMVILNQSRADGYISSGTRRYARWAAQHLAAGDFVGCDGFCCQAASMVMEMAEMDDDTVMSRRQSKHTCQEAASCSMVTCSVQALCRGDDC